MRRISVIFFIAGLVLFNGCAQESAEEAAKHFVDEQIAKHQGFELDTSKLTYEVVEQETGSVMVVVSGDIAVKGEIPMVNDGGKWVVAANSPQPLEKAHGEQAQKEKAAAEVASSHRIETKAAKAPAH
jgi:hypothetical protein